MRLQAIPGERFRDDPAYGYALPIDLAGHVIASEGCGVPRDYRDTFSILEQRQVIGAPLAERLRRLAGLRNRLVHLDDDDDDVDDDVLLAAAADGVDDLDGFARAVARLLV